MSAAGHYAVLLVFMEPPPPPPRSQLLISMPPAVLLCFAQLFGSQTELLTCTAAAASPRTEDQLCCFFRKTRLGEDDCVLGIGVCVCVCVCDLGEPKLQWAQSTSCWLCTVSVLPRVR